MARWAGFTSAVFSLCQAMTGLLWGAASDRFGRKPIIMVGLACTMMGAIFFGFSQTLAWAFTARAIQGLCNGNVGIIRTMVAEMVPQRELQPKAFSVMPLVWTIGSILGPALGGSLANPAVNHPELFGKNRFFITFPYALPNLVASLFFMIGLTTGILFVRETLEAKKHQKDYGLVCGRLLTRSCTRRKHESAWLQRSNETDPFLGTDHGRALSSSMGKTTTQLPKKVRYRDVFSHQSNVNLAVYTLLAMHSVACDQLLPIHFHHPSQSIHDPKVKLPFQFSGGFSLDSGRIGLLFTLYGVFGMFIQFLVFPPLARKYGVLNCLRACGITFPIIYALIPFTALLPMSWARQAVVFALMLCKCWTVIFAFPCSTILLTNSAVSLSILGTLNGIATSISALGRAAGPALAGSTFTAGVHAGYVLVPWWTLALVALLGLVPMFWLVEMEGFTASGSREFSDDEPESTIPTSPKLPPASRPALPRLTTEEAIENEDAIESTTNLTKMSRSNEERRTLSPEQEMPGPIGMVGGVPSTSGGRKFSDNLGATRSGYGTGGASYQ